MKKTIKENIRVEVEPEKAFYEEEDRFIISDCELIKEQIKRHVDKVESAIVTWDTRHYCEFCDSDWEVMPDDSDPDFLKGEPVCCTKASDEFRLEKEGMPNNE